MTYYSYAQFLKDNALPNMPSSYLRYASAYPQFN